MLQACLVPIPSGELQVAAQAIAPYGTEHQLSTSSVRLSLVIPTYNERDNIVGLVQTLSQRLDACLPHQYELIIVDDDSPDETWKLALSLTTQYPALRVMRRQQETGLSTAVIRGWQVAEGEILGVIDGDLQHPPETLLQLFACMDDGADLAVASRHVEGGGVSHWSLLRRTLSRGAQVLGLVLLPRVVGRLSDPMSGYFLVRRQAIANRVMNPKGYKILLEVVGRGHIDCIAEVGYVFQERQQGHSKVSWKHYRDYLHHLLRLRVTSGSWASLTRRIWIPLGRLIRFGLVGISGVFVDMGVLYLLHGTMGLGLTRSAIAAAELAILNNFLWNDRWTFGDLARHQRLWHQTLKRLLKFNLICLMGVILKVLILNLLFNGLHMNPYGANLLAIALVTLWNFWINLKLNWRVTEIR